MQTALITGAGGFIGGRVVHEFIAHGWHVLAAVRHHIPDSLRELERSGRLRLLVADLADPVHVANLAAAWQNESAPATLVHCAGRASDVGWDREFRRANLDSVRHLGQLVLAHTIPRFVFLSTTDVYGLFDFHGEDEVTLPLKAFPKNPYPAYKIEAERWIQAILPPDRYALLRPAQVWGPGDTTLTRRIVDFLRMSPWIVHFGKHRGANRWPLAHVQNVATACYLAATSPSAAGHAINVLDDEHTTIDEWYRLVAAIYLPEKRHRTMVLPLGVGHLVALPVQWISSALNLHHPFTDPSHYALHAVSAHLDFSNVRLHQLFAAGGRQLVTRAQGLDELHTNVH